MNHISAIKHIRRIVGAYDHVEAAKALYARLAVGDKILYRNARGEYEAVISSISARGVVKAKFAYANGVEREVRIRHQDFIGR